MTSREKVQLLEICKILMKMVSNEEERLADKAEKTPNPPPGRLNFKGLWRTSAGNFVYVFSFEKGRWYAHQINENGKVITEILHIFDQNGNEVGKSNIGDLQLRKREGGNQKDWPFISPVESELLARLEQSPESVDHSC